MLDDASRGAVVEHAASFLRPKGGAITAGMAQRFRRQVVAAAIFLSIPEDLSHDPIDIKISFRAISSSIFNFQQSCYHRMILQSIFTQMTNLFVR